MHNVFCKIRVREVLQVVVSWFAFTILVDASPTVFDTSLNSVDALKWFCVVLFLQVRAKLDGAYAAAFQYTSEACARVCFLSELFLMFTTQDPTKMESSCRLLAIRSNAAAGLIRSRFPVCLTLLAAAAVGVAVSQRAAPPHRDVSVITSFPKSDGKGE